MSEQFEKVKKGLVCCERRGYCEGHCPYYEPEKGALECTSELAHDALALISHLDESVEPLKAQKPGWISVKDRLPEGTGEEYIVYITSNDGEKCVTCDHLVCSSRKHWFLFDDEKAVVTHWMPLPEPPKGEI